MRTVSSCRLSVSSFPVQLYLQIVCMLIADHRRVCPPGTFVRARTLPTGPTIEERLLNCGSGRHANVSGSMKRRTVRTVKRRPRTRMSAEEAARAGAFMRRCLTIDPSKRPSAKELLEDEWLKGV